MERAAATRNGTSNLRLATSDGVVLAQVRGEIPHLGECIVFPLDSSSSLPMDTLTQLGEWRRWMSMGSSERTVDYYWQVAFRYLAVVPKPLEEHGEVDVMSWLETFPPRSASRRSYYNALLSLFGWAARTGIIERNFVRDIQVKAPVEKQPQALTQEQFEAVRQAAFEHHPVRGYTVELLYYSAARITEARHITWDDLTDEGIVLRITKGGRKERIVPWSNGLRHAIAGLRGYFGDGPRVLPRSGQTVNEWVKKAGRDAKVPINVHCHLFRSTAATTSLVNGAHIHAVKSYLGHSKITTTQRYLAASQTDMQDVADALDRAGEGA